MRFLPRNSHHEMPIDFIVIRSKSDLFWNVVVPNNSVERKSLCQSSAKPFIDGENISSPLFNLWATTKKMKFCWYDSINGMEGVNNKNLIVYHWVSWKVYECELFAFSTSHVDWNLICLKIVLEYIEKFTFQLHYNMKFHEGLHEKQFCF